MSIGALAGVVITVLVLSGLTQQMRLPINEVMAIIRMRMSLQSAEEQVRGCRAFMERSYADPNSVDFLIWAGGMDRVLEAMGSFPLSKEVQGTCSDCVASLCQWRLDIVNAAGGSGAVELLVASMKNFEEDPDMHKAGNIGFLLHRSPENRMRWDAAGGMEVNMAAIRRHYNHSSLQLQAWCAFAAGVGEPNEPRFHELGGVELAARVMREHAGSYRVREQVMQTMRTIAAHSDELRSAAVRSGFVDAAVSAMLDSPADLHLQAVACGIFGNLAEGDDSHRAALLVAGAIEATVVAVRTFPEMSSPVSAKQGIRYTVYGECFKALEALAASDAARHAILSILTREEVITGMRSEPEDWKVQTGGAGLLRILTH